MNETIKITRQDLIKIFQLAHNMGFLGFTIVHKASVIFDALYQQQNPSKESENDE